MLALALNGQRGAAVAQYEACRRVLREELGVEPGPETRRLYERIRDGEFERVIAGRYAESQQVVEAYSVIADEQAVWNLRSFGSYVAAETYLHLGQYEQARARACTALALSREGAMEWDTGAALGVLGDVAAAEGVYMEARQRLQESLAVFRRMHRDFKDMVLVHLALVEQAVGRRQGTDGPEGGDLHTDASAMNGQAMAAHGYEYDGSRGLYEMEYQSYERYYAPLERGGQPMLDFYSPCRKKGE